MIDDSQLMNKKRENLGKPLKKWQIITFFIMEFYTSTNLLL